MQNEQADLILSKIDVKSPADAGAIVVALKELPMQDDILTKLISKTTALALQSQRNHDLAARRATQDYTNIWKYMTDFKCLSLQQSRDKLNWLRVQTSMLGLTNPSERTFQMLTALLLTCERSPQEVSPATKFESLKALKVAFARAKVSQPLGVSFLMLPEPDELVQRHAGLAASFFGEEGWSATQLNQVQLMAMADNIPMRSSRRDSKVHVLVETKPDSGTMAFAQQLSQQLQQMQYMQAFTLQALQGNQHTGSAVLSGCNPQSSPSLIGQQFLAAPMLPTLAPTPSSPLAIVDATAPGSNAPNDSNETQEVAEEPKASVGKGMSLDEVTRKLQAGMDSKKKEKLPAESKKVPLKKQKVLNKMPQKAGAKSTSGGHKQSMTDKKADKVVAKTKSAGKKAKTLKTHTAKSGSKSTSTCPLSKARRLKLRPEGCGKCRYKPGCTPSCFKGYTAKR